MQSNSTTQPTHKFQHIDSRMQNDVSVNIFIGFTLLIPIIVFAGFNIYKKQRAAVLSKQIASLEKLWLLNTNQRA